MGGRAPLEDVLVVSIEHAVAGPLATRHLADLGARIIKVERPDGGDFARSYDSKVRGMSSHFVWLNRGKESVSLDLNQAEQRAALDRMLDRADVFLQNLAPTTAQRLGLEAEQVIEGRDRLIACSISGYGQGGPFRDQKAYDLLIQAEAGITSLTGTEGAPAKVGIPVADIGAGVYAFSGILAALYSRGQTGRGAALRVSLFDALAEWMGYPAYYTQYGGSQPPRSGLSHAAIAPYGPFKAAGGEQVVIAVQNEREWRSFCGGVLGDAGLADDPRFATNDARVANRQLLDARIANRLALYSADELTAALHGAGIAVGRLRTVEEFLEHPAITSRSRRRTVHSPVGPLDALLPPIEWVGHPARMGAIPDLGEHTAEVFCEFGSTHVV